MADPLVGQTVAADWEAVVGKTPEDNIHPQYWLEELLSKGKAFKSIDGGRTINGPIEYALNTTVKWFTDTEAMDTSRVDVFDEFSFAWKQLGGTVVMSSLEKAKNQGSGAKFDLEPAKLDNLKNSMFGQLNRSLFSDGTGTGGKEAGGLQYLISATPATGTVGGINRATFSFWRSNQALGTLTATAYDNLRAAMRTMYNSCSSGVDAKHPTGIVTTQTVFGGYESVLTANETVVGKDRASFDAGFKNEYAAFKGAFVGYDASCPSGCMYFFNTDNLKLAYQKGYWMKGYPSVMPANQVVEVFVVETICNLYTNNPRRLGVLTVIT